MEDSEDQHKPAPAAWRRTLLVAAGFFCVALAIAGIVLPLLPTTPFLLLAAACFARSSPRLDAWLHNNRLFGPYLRAYRHGHGIPLRAKLSIVTLLWLSVALSALFAVPDRLWALRFALIAVALLVSIHVLRIKTFRRTEDQA